MISEAPSEAQAGRPKIKQRCGDFCSDSAAPPNPAPLLTAFGGNLCGWFGVHSLWRTQQRPYLLGLGEKKCQLEKKVVSWKTKSVGKKKCRLEKNDGWKKNVDLKKMSVGKKLSVRENRDLLGFGGVWALREIPDHNRHKQFDPKKNRKK